MPTLVANAYFRSRIGTVSKRWFFGTRFSVALLHNLADFTPKIHFGCEKPEHPNVPNVDRQSVRSTGRLRDATERDNFQRPCCDFSREGGC